LAGITVVPNVEWLFVDHGKAYSLNVDGTMTVLPFGVASGYVGGGWAGSPWIPTRGQQHRHRGQRDRGRWIHSDPAQPLHSSKYVFVDGDDPLVFSIGARF
jgi:hypothetical protein